MATRGTNLMSAPVELDQATVIEEVFCDLERVVCALDLLTDGLHAPVGGAEGAALQLLREKLFDSAQRLNDLLGPR